MCGSACEGVRVRVQGERCESECVGCEGVRVRVRE